MSTGPTFYYPTTDLPYVRTIPAVKYYYDTAGNTVYEVGLDKQIQFYTDPSNTYCGPLGQGGFQNSYRIASPSNRRGITLSDPAYSLIEIFKQLPIERRGLQPFMFNNTILYQFADDSIPLAGNTLGMYAADGNAFNKGNAWWGLWPDNGICFTQDWAEQVFSSMAQIGVTAGYLMIDNEMVIFDTSNSSHVQAITGATQYTLPWRGLSSWYDYYLLEGGETNYIFTNTPTGIKNGRAFSAAWNRIKNKAMTDAFTSAMLKYNPNGIVSDYMEYKSLYMPGYTALYMVGEYGTPETITHRTEVGNASSPVLYGWFSVGPVMDRGNYKLNTPAVSYINPTVIYSYDNSYQDSILDKYFTLGPWASFISCVSEMKEVKRNRPNLPITPWIPSPWQIGQYNNDYGTIYKRDFLWTQSVNQMRVQIAHNRWRFKNIDTEIGGFTGPTGLTNGIRIITNSTSEQKLLAYVYNGITSGVTYVFSYYVNLNSGYTGFGVGFNNFRRTHYGQPTGITFYQILPAATGPFYSTGGIYYPPGSSGWTQVQFKFSVPGTDPLDPIFNPTLEAAIIQDSITSGGNTMFITDPTFEIESSPSNISVITPTSIISEDNRILGARGPACGFANAMIGYNPRSAMYITDRPGNSAYFYELVRHCCLLGSKSFGWFNPFSFVDNSYPGAKTYGFDGQSALDTGKTNIALRNGFTGFIEDYKLMNQTLHDVHQKIKGFTLATAGATDYWNWSLPYFASAAPDTKGQTWWWRITVQNGYTLYVNGMTLPNANGSVGMWLGTTGPTLAGVSITHTPPIPQPEPSGITAVRDFNFITMNSLADLTGNSFSFSRGSTGSYIGPSGYVLFAPAGQPRFHYDPITLRKKGLLLEIAATNLLNWSESFASTGGSQNNWVDTNISRTSGNTSPANDLSAIRFTATGSNATLISSSPVATTTEKVFSFWCKGVTGTENLSYTVNGGTTWNSIPNITSNWNRISFGPIFAGNCFFNHHVGFRLGNTNDSVLLWGAQLENSKFGSNPNEMQIATKGFNYNRETSYIRTQASTASRSADSLSFVGFTSWLGETYGTLIIEEENMKFDTGNWFTIRGFSGGNSVDLRFGANDTGIRMDTADFRTGSWVDTIRSMGYCFTTRFHSKDIPHKWFVSWSPLGYQFGGNSIIKSMADTKPVRNIGNLFFANEFTIKSFRYYDRVFEESIMRQFLLGGVTQIGWLNNGDGIVHPVTYYNIDENA